METMNESVWEPSLIAGEIDIAVNNRDELLLRVVDGNINDARYNDCWANMTEDEKQLGKTYNFKEDSNAAWADERLIGCIDKALLPVLERCRNELTSGNREVHIAEALRNTLMQNEKPDVKPIALFILPPPEKRAYAFFKLNPIN